MMLVAEWRAKFDLPSPGGLDSPLAPDEPPGPAPIVTP